MPYENRLHLLSPKEGFIGVDRLILDQDLSLGHFFSTDNIVPNETSGLTRRLGASLTVNNPAGTTTALFLFTFQRRTAASQLLIVYSRPALSDALFQYNNTTGVTLIGALLGTNLTYHMIQYKDKVFIFDGTNAPQQYDGTTLSTLTGTGVPSAGQYGMVYQDRLCIGVPTTDLMWFSNVLDETTFPASNFINLNFQKGDIITGLAINTNVSGERGSQTQFVAFKTRSCGVFNGTLGDSSATLTLRTSLVGTTSYRTIVNTQYGLFFLGQQYFGQDNTLTQTKVVSVWYIPTSANEPLEVGYQIRPQLKLLTDTQLLRCSAVENNQFYKLTCSDGTSTINNNEWWLDLKPENFVDRRRWFGPNTGNNAAMYSVYRNSLFATQESSNNLWQLDLNVNFQYMLDVTARQWQVSTGALQSPDVREINWEAFGVDITFSAAPFTLSCDFTNELGTLDTQTATPAISSRQKVIFRPQTARQSRKMTANLRGGTGATSSITINGFHWRLKPSPRQGGMW